MTINIEGGSPADTNIPMGDTNGRLILDTAEHPPTGNGWYATYSVDVPEGGPHLIEMEPPPGPEFASVALSINGDPAELDGSIELLKGKNTITFAVSEPFFDPNPDKDADPDAVAMYRLRLNALTLIKTEVALQRPHVGDPRTTYSICSEAPTLSFSLNGRTPEDLSIAYTVSDYFSNEVKSGMTAIAAGERTASVLLPDLDPGHYIVTVWPTQSPDETTIGFFARLPDREPIDPDRNRFAVDTAASWGVPLARIDPFASAIAKMGVGYVRDRMSWPAVEKRRGAYDMALSEGFAAAFHRNGLQTCVEMEYAPKWARTEESEPLPADPRDAYNLAKRAAAMGADAIEPWYEPETKRDINTADKHAAYLKASALGLHDGDGDPVVAMTANVVPGKFFDLLLENDIISYVDVWNYHGYSMLLGPHASVAPHIDMHQALHERFGPERELWMTECGIFIALEEGKKDLTRAQQQGHARYMVRSIVTAIARGTDKVFWFLAIPFAGHPNPQGQEHFFGLFSTAWQPLAAFSAYAALTALLGQADFVEQLNGLPEPAEGYVFANGARRVTVVWSETSAAVRIPVFADAAIHDMMGTCRTAQEDQGFVTVTASLDPVYVVSSHPEHAPTPRAPRHFRVEPTDAQRIVLRQVYERANWPTMKNFRDPSLTIGYLMDGVTPMSVDVYNFGDGDAAVTVVGRADAGWSVEPAQQDVVVPPMEARRVGFTVTASPDVAPSVDHTLRFDGSRSGDAVSPSVSRIQLRAAVDETPAPLKSYDTPDEVIQ